MDRAWWVTVRSSSTQKSCDTAEQLTLSPSSSRGWGPRALSPGHRCFPAAVLERGPSACGFTTIFPLSPISSPHPAPQLLAQALRVPLWAPHLCGTATVLCWTCCLLPFFSRCLGWGPQWEGGTRHKVENEKTTDLKSLQQEWKNKTRRRGQ